MAQCPNIVIRHSQFVICCSLLDRPGNRTGYPAGLHTGPKRFSILSHFTCYFNLISAILPEVSTKEFQVRRSQSTQKARSYLQLLIAVGAIILIQPFVESESTALENLILTIFFLGFLVSSLHTISLKTVGPRKPLLIWLIRTIALAAFVSDISATIVFGTLQRYNTLLAISTMSYACLIFLLCVFIIRDIFSGEKVTSDKIYGAITVYLLLGLLFGCLYVFLDTIIPGAITNADGRILTSFSETLYFSYTTLCTVGYGDIAARHKVAMLFSNLEAIIGQLYLTILVARLVSLHLFHSRRHPDQPSPAK